MITPKRISLGQVLVAAALLLAGCSMDNGMPKDLAEHLRSRQIVVHPKRVSAPLSSRGGFVAVDYDSATMVRIIRAYDLRQVPLEDPEWVATQKSLEPGLRASQIWGATRRPVQFRLKDGGQFEYFYLVVTPGGEMYLFAEYAFG